MSATAEKVPVCPSEEDLLLTKDAAKMLLQARGCTVMELLRVHVDSILYLGSGRRPMTAWLLRLDSGRLEIRTESGFPAEATYGLLPRQDVSTMYPDEMDQA